MKKKVKVADGLFGRAEVGIPLKQFIALKILGFAKVPEERSPPAYVVWCPFCRMYFLDYLHGYDGDFHCPGCLEKRGKAPRSL